MTSRFCRCALPLARPGGDQVSWIPSVDREPKGVKAVTITGQDPAFLRMEREPGGWRYAGAAASHAHLDQPSKWSAVGLCWANSEHPVVDVVSVTP